MKITRYADIPQFTRSAGYTVDVEWNFLQFTLDRFEKANGLDMDPDFQRAHVWDEVRQVRYVEFCLRGGQSSRDIFWNCPTWHRLGGDFVTDQPIVLVDGKQRMEAVRRFIADEIPVFGSYHREFTDHPRIQKSRFHFHINDLQTRAETLQYYIDLNSGGVAHTDAEIAKVRKLLEVEKAKVNA